MTTTKVKSNSYYVFKKKTLPKIWIALKILLGLIFISPVLVGFVFSFVPNHLLNGLPSLSQIVNNLTLDNYKWVLGYVPVFRYLLNTLIVCGATVCSSTILSCMAGYAFACFEFKGRAFLFNLILVAMMIPADVTVITNYLNVQKWGLVNTYPGLFITMLVGGTAIFMMRQYFLQLPKDIKEAAVMDGCGHMRFLLQIGIPMAIPTISALAITEFIGVYNRYFWPMLIAQTKEMQTIQIGMAMLVDVETANYGNILAGAMICIIAPVIVFLFAEDYIIKGMTAGAVKG